MKLLRKHKLLAKLSNYDFYEYRIHYLGHHISGEGISMDLEKIEAIMSWPAPRKMTDVRSFVGLARYYGNLTIEDSAGKVNPMYRLRKIACELVLPRRNYPCVYGNRFEDFLKTQVE